MRPFHLAARIEDFPGSKPTVKQKLAVVRRLFDFLVVRQIVSFNRADAVRGPERIVKTGTRIPLPRSAPLTELSYNL